MNDGWKEGWNVFLRYDVMRGATEVYIAKYFRDGTVEVARPIDLNMKKKVSVGELFEPTLVFRGHDARQFLQGLADGLAENGFHPDELKAFNKELKAMNNHLEDMRKLVFKENYDRNKN